MYRYCKIHTRYRSYKSQEAEEPSTRDGTALDTLHIVSNHFIGNFQVIRYLNGNFLSNDRVLVVGACLSIYSYGISLRDYPKCKRHRLLFRQKTISGSEYIAFPLCWTLCAQIHEEPCRRRKRQVQSHGAVLGRGSRISHTRSCQRTLRDENSPRKTVRGKNEHFHLWNYLYNVIWLDNMRRNTMCMRACYVPAHIIEI